MADPYDEFIRVVQVIQADPELKGIFIKVLEPASDYQEVRVQKLHSELQELNAPQEVLTFLKLLGNDQLAQAVYQQLTEI